MEILNIMIDVDAKMKRVYIVTFIGIVLAITFPIFISFSAPGPLRGHAEQIIFTLMMLGPIVCGLYSVAKAIWFGWHKAWRECLKASLCGAILIAAHFVYGVVGIIMATGGTT